MCRIELSGFWIEFVGKSFMYSVIAIVTFILAIKLICISIRDWRIKEDLSVNIAIFVLALVILSISFNAAYMILNMWGILEIVIV
jgi:hypothetical protein